MIMITACMHDCGCTEMTLPSADSRHGGLLREWDGMSLMTRVGSHHVTWSAGLLLHMSI